MSEVAQCLNGPVQAGDLVRVVLATPCCGNAKHVGREFRVAHIGLSRCCAYCHAGGDLVLCGPNAICGFPASTLLRIDPPAQPETITTDEEVTA